MAGACGEGTWEYVGGKGRCDWCSVYVVVGRYVISRFISLHNDVNC